MTTAPPAGTRVRDTRDTGPNGYNRPRAGTVLRTIRSPHPHPHGDSQVIAVKWDRLVNEQTIWVGFVEYEPVAGLDYPDKWIPLAT